ncbi:MAG TPA: tetratricopeptide repeat protein [Bacteroidales bacterium]|nr:tetratricopeptide repeat protein [Bacteroidales bacterium]
MKLASTLVLSLFFLIANSQTADEYYEKAVNSVNSNHYSAGLRLIDKAISLDADKADYYIIKAVCYHNLEKYDEALETYDTAMQLFPDSAFLYSLRGVQLQSMRIFDKALANHNIAIKLAKDDSLSIMCYVNRSACYMATRNFKMAYNDLMSAYAIDSMNLNVLNNLGTVCDELGKDDDVFKYLFKIIEIDSTYYGAYINVGFKYQQMGLYDKSLVYFDKAIVYEDDEPLLYSNRSYSRLMTGDLKGAMQDIEKSIKMYPGNSYAYRNRALIYIAQEKFEEACEDLQTALNNGFTEMYGDEVLTLQSKYCK